MSPKRDDFDPCLDFSMTTSFPIKRALQTTVKKPKHFAGRIGISVDERASSIDAAAFESFTELPKEHNQDPLTKLDHLKTIFLRDTEIDDVRSNASTKPTQAT